MHLATSINRNKTRSFPGAEIGNDHDMVMMTLDLRLQIPDKTNNFTRNKCNRDKLKNTS